MFSVAWLESPLAPAREQQQQEADPTGKLPEAGAIWSEGSEGTAVVCIVGAAPPLVAVGSAPPPSAAASSPRGSATAPTAAAAAAASLTTAAAATKSPSDGVATVDTGDDEDSTAATVVARPADCDGNVDASRGRISEKLSLPPSWTMPPPPLRSARSPPAGGVKPRAGDEKKLPSRPSSSAPLQSGSA